MTTMYGYTKNKSSFSDRPCVLSRQDTTTMFSVDGIVGFETQYKSSPDGADCFKGQDMLSAPYFTQAEIDSQFEEYDNTKVWRSGDGVYDTCARQKLKSLWALFSEECQRFTGCKNSHYIFGIKDVDQPLLDKRFLLGCRIEEVRENPGKFLHVYKISKASYDIVMDKCNGFDKAVAMIKKEAPIIKANYGLKHWREGAPLLVMQQNGNIFVVGDKEEDDDGARTVWLKIAIGVKPGRYTVNIFGWDVYLHIPEDYEASPRIDDTSRVTYWGKSYYEDITKPHISLGMFFLNNIDVYPQTMDSIRRTATRYKNQRVFKFEELENKLLQAGMSQSTITKIVDQAKKGAVLRNLSVATEIFSLLGDEKRVFELMQKLADRSPGVIINYAWLISEHEEGRINWHNLSLVIKKAYAWDYIRNVFPNLEQLGCFDDTMEAFKLFQRDFAPVS